MQRIAIWTATVALAAAIAHADAIPSRSVAFSYKVAIESIPADAQTVNVWVPVPQTNDYQTVTNVRVTGANSHRFVVDEAFGNRFVLIAVRRGVTHTSFELSFDVNRYLRRNLGGNANPAAGPLDDPAAYLRPTRMMRIDGPVAEEARRVVGAVTDPLVQARKLYDHIVDTVDYDKSGEGWGRGDTDYACDVRKGNCTDFHSLFMGEAISLGIPARFLMGFSLPTDASEGPIAGYHCWAEFYIDGRGWIPVDASEARKDPTRREELFGELDQHRVLFTMGRDIPVPEAQGAPLNFSIYPYAEVDGRPHEAIQTRFAYRDLN